MERCQACHRSGKWFSGSLCHMKVSDRVGLAASYPRPTVRMKPVLVGITPVLVKYKYLHHSARLILKFPICCSEQEFTLILWRTSSLAALERVSVLLCSFLACREAWICDCSFFPWWSLPWLGDWAAYSSLPCEFYQGSTTLANGSEIFEALEVFLRFV